MNRLSPAISTVGKIGKTLVPIIGGLALLVVVIGWLAGAFEPKIEPSRREAAARRLAGQPTDEVHEVTKLYIEEAVGTLKSASRSVISAKVLARINEITVSSGDEVQKGELLVQLDNDDLQARLKQAQQALSAAQANRDQATVSYERVKRLVAERAGAQADLDEAERRLAVTKAEVLRSEQAVAEAAVMLSYATITAPKSGRIVERLAEPGDTARPGEPLLVLYDAASLRLEAPVPEELAVSLAVGDKLNVYIDALEREFEASVDEIVPQADAPSRTFLVKASLPRSDDLYEGMFGRLRIPAGERRHLCLATAAIQRVGQLEFVEVALPDGSLERRYIKTGRLGMPGRIEVLSGLKAGERVVLQPEPAETTGERESDA